LNLQKPISVGLSGQMPDEQALCSQWFRVRKGFDKRLWAHIEY